MKKLTALLLVLAMLVTLAACTKKDEKKEPKDSTAPIETKAPAQLVDAPVLNINEIYGLSPEGQKATLANTLSLTDEDKAAVKEGNYKVAICMHQMDNDVNVMKVNTIKKILGDLGVEIIAVTDGQSSVEQRDHPRRYPEHRPRPVGGRPQPRPDAPPDAAVHRAAAGHQEHPPGHRQRICDDHQGVVHLLYHRRAGDHVRRELREVRDVLHWRAADHRCLRVFLPDVPDVEDHPVF